jgi:hypothetical protein
VLVEVLLGKGAVRSPYLLLGVVKIYQFFGVKGVNVKQANGEFVGLGVAEGLLFDEQVACCSRKPIKLYLEKGFLTLRPGVNIIVFTPWVFGPGVRIKAKRNVAVVEAIGYGKF